MVTSTFITIFFALILSLFTLTSALPTQQADVLTVITKPLAEPRSLLGRHYVRQVAADPASSMAVRSDNIARGTPTRRADRFHAIQRRIARNSAEVRAEEELDENLLSNQSMVVPSSETLTQPPASNPTPAAVHTTAPNTSVTFIPRPHTRKHSNEGQKNRGGN